ncbi:hypothetical protein HPDFL43_00010460 [Hoeflea phototrophica DFL-43]|uniref:Uncharacterized protein n=1 Tax=Hoeflea phototrophica (strain DSM 17068 / NCIMB 14078 / DFL-43) TaxID=411684 RepID=A0A095BE23_HOEPD|nr:hypothetical protein HPDFL43_00010460 [Hoeflea phototrophica DFL-43]
MPDCFFSVTDISIHLSQMYIFSNDGTPTIRVQAHGKVREPKSSNVCKPTATFPVSADL